MMRWNYQEDKEIRMNIQQAALQAIAKVIEGEADEDVKYHRICGIMTMIEEIVDDMLETKRMDDADKKALAESGKAAAEAFDNLFVTKTWKIGGNANADT